MITAMPRVAIAVRDFDAIFRSFRDRFGMPVLDESENALKTLGARIGMCVPPGGSCIELMSPGDPNAPLSQSLQRFLDRRGEGFFALMLEAPDPDAEAETLASRGLNVLPLMPGASGRDIHPNSTHGVLIRVYPMNSFKVQSHRIQEDPEKELGLSGVTRVIIAVEDLEQAMGVYADQFAMDVGQASLDPERGIKRAICTPPSGGLIELVSVVDRNQPFAGSIAEFLEKQSEGIYGLALRSPDVPRAAKLLAQRGLKVRPSTESGGAIEIERSHNFGALIRIEPG